MRISSALRHLRSSCRDVYDTRMSVCPAVWSEPSGAGQPSKNIQQRTGHSAQSKVIKHDHERRDGGDGATNDKTHKGSCTHTQGSRSDFTISFCTRVLVMSCVEIGDVSATSRGDRMIQHPVCSQHSVEQNLVSSPCVSAPPYRARGGVCIVQLYRIPAHMIARLTVTVTRVTDTSATARHNARRPSTSVSKVVDQSQSSEAHNVV